jgi:hypothetical protein
VPICAGGDNNRWSAQRLRHNKLSYGAVTRRSQAAASAIAWAARSMNGAALRQMRNVRCLFGLNGFLEFLSRNAARLREAGVPVVLSRWAGMNHGFLFWVGVSGADRRIRPTARRG